MEEMNLLPLMYQMMSLKMVRCLLLEKPLLERGAGGRIQIGLIGTALRDRRAAAKGGDLLPRIDLRPGQ